MISPVKNGNRMQGHCQIDVQEMSRNESEWDESSFMEVFSVTLFFCNPLKLLNSNFTLKISTIRK